MRNWSAGDSPSYAPPASNSPPDRYTSSDKPYTERFDRARRLAGMVLISTSTARREHGLRKALRAKISPMPVATASRDHGDPDRAAGEVWSLVTAEGDRARRVRLGALPALIGGTTDDGTPSVLANLPRQPAPVPFVAGEDDEDDVLVITDPDDPMAEW
jgi:hypothetical protein